MNTQPPYGYQGIVPLTKTHKVQLLRGRQVSATLRSLSALPLSFTEFAPAVHDYPIIFISGDGGKSLLAMALLGVESGQNLFIDDEAWDAQTYMPAYVRRYPFCMSRVTLDGKEQAERIACVEKAAINAKGEALHDGKGEALPAWEELRKLLFEFETDLGRTEALCHRLQELQLFEPFAAQATPTGEAPITLTGMHRVSEEKLHALPADTLKELAQSGMLARVYIHLLSLGNFQRLLDRRARRKGTAKPQPA